MIGQFEGILDELSERGLVAQVSDETGLREHLKKRRVVYCGFDPTADSLHVGSLVPLIALNRFQRAGHKPILLLGGATGLIGDPSFRSDERLLIDSDVVEKRVVSLRKQVEPFLSFTGENSALIVNNLDWSNKVLLIDFLRDIGKYFSINKMIQRDAVKPRLDAEGQGISFTEFTYMILQSMDFLELAVSNECTIQIGGSDQWGNMVSGIDLIRRKLSLESYALTLPLITKADGTKFGKSEAGAVWLERSKTSPYSFYQFWLNTSDADVEKFLKFFTFIPSEEIVETIQRTKEKPEDRIAQRVLADHMTQFVHGEKDRLASRRISSALFSENFDGLEQGDLEQLLQDGLPSRRCKSGEGLLSTMVSSNLAKSNGEARKLIHGRGISVNGSVITDPSISLDFEGALYGQYLLLKKGKKSYVLLCREH
uniref:Tyrosine--tRNA ligase n=1 Tax=uncultured gamma proteobacterium HF0070_08D07 TaxID=710983 RepID=E0XRY3_9GAMM|nr:tyrosyl-tRNA synthetase [uncultured gamma proteobacterium HF0070_08D07]